MEKKADNIFKLIERSSSVVILPHINADGDAIASSQAMKCLINRMGKDAVIYVEERPEQRLEFISHGVKLYSGSTRKCDLCIVLDCGETERLGRRRTILDDVDYIINIDHHKTSAGFGTESLVMPEACATGEVLAILFEKWGAPMDTRIARYLYAAICSDSGCFAYSNVSPRTFRIAAKLIEYDIDHAEIARQLFDCVDLQEELLKAELLKSVHSLCGGALKTVALTRETEEAFGLRANKISSLVDIPRRIRGCEIAASLKYCDNGVRVSLRSNGAADVAAIALKFGGGGHTKAAGCTIEVETLEEAEGLLEQACETELK